MTERTPVSKALRFQILRRDNHACRYCGAKAPDATLTVDHVLPVTLGGQTVAENLVTACQDCNQGKAGTPPDAETAADVQADAVRWSRAMRAAAAAQLQRRQQRERYIEAINEAWSNWSCGPDRLPVPRPNNWRDSAGRFHDLDLELAHAQDLVAVAMRNQRVRADHTWRYYCGACWTVLRERAEMAEGFVLSDEQEKLLQQSLQVSADEKAQLAEEEPF
jgi:HNH endonuclease